ncbi:MAG: alpha/beta hydrolase, partial [Chloroflexi bacterium AL-N10]|nr:alpha/beta hydrolase [Chloroflexi bacterium AL-N10]
PSGQRIPTPQTALTEWHWALLASGLNNTWEWLEKDLTLVTIPGAGHFVQQDTPELVNRAMLSWLNR